MNSIREDLILTTVALYRVTDLLPETEPLRIKMRKLALDILTGSFLGRKEVRTQIDILLLCFEICLRQNWLNEKNFLVLKKEYINIKESLPENRAKNKLVAKKEKPKKIQNISDYNSKKGRQKGIIRLAKNNQGKTTLEQLKQEFSDVSTRTLRRDMNSLVDKGLVKRIRKGKKDIDYILKNNVDK